jgi:predicted DNA repair protein MutK
LAGASLLALLDDIAALMDDVSVMTKVAARKTAGVLGDDLAVNAEKVTGVAADRELPVVYAVFKGSLLNKAILVPAALVIAASPLADRAAADRRWAVSLCFEGFEKGLARPGAQSRARRAETESLRARSRRRCGPLALRETDSRSDPHGSHPVGRDHRDHPGIVGDASLAVRAGVLSAIALIMTVGVYGLVAADRQDGRCGPAPVPDSTGEGLGGRAGRALGRGSWPLRRVSCAC